jgi:hypothetical protein
MAVMNVAISWNKAPVVQLGLHGTISQKMATFIT